MAASNTVIITSSTDWGTISKSSFPITITMTANSVGDPTLIRANLNYDIPMGEISGEEDEKAFTTIPFSGEGSYEMIITYDMIKNSVLEGENYIYLSLGYGADIGYDRIDFTFIKESEKSLFVGVSKTPNEYQQIEYLESTGMQYIDTGVNGDAIGTYEIKFNMLGEGYQNYEMYFAGPLSAQVPKLYLNGDTAIVADIGTAAYDLFTKDNNPHTIKITNTEILCDNIIKATYEAKPWGDQSFWLFSAAEQPSLYSTVRLYYLKMYSDGVLVRNYIPCYRKEDNISGLYDIVNNIFYENESMGNFVAGKVVKGITKKAKEMFIGINGAAKKVKEAFIGINGIARKIFEANALIINFTIGGSAYQAEKNMTWAEWLESNYNIDNFAISGDNVSASIGTTNMVTTEDGNLVVLEDIIIADYSYDVELQGAGGY